MRSVIEGTLSQTASYAIVHFRLDRSVAEPSHKVALLTNSRELARRDVSVGEPKCAHVRIRKIWPPVCVRRKAGGLLIAIQPWECGSVPIICTAGINNVHADSALSEHTKRGYIQSGIDFARACVVPDGANFEAVPHGVDTRRGRKKLSEAICRKGDGILAHALDTLVDKILNGLELMLKEPRRDTRSQGQSLGRRLVGTPQTDQSQNIS